MEWKDVGKTAAAAPVGMELVLAVETAETDQPDAPTAAPAAASAPAPDRLNDGQWLDSLRDDPAYAGIDVLREHAKAARWCLEHRKQLTRKRFVNWLNRCDKPMAAPGTRDTEGSVRSKAW